MFCRCNFLCNVAKSGDFLYFAKNLCNDLWTKSPCKTYNLFQFFKVRKYDTFSRYHNVRICVLRHSERFMAELILNDFVVYSYEVSK